MTTDDANGIGPDDLTVEDVLHPFEGFTPGHHEVSERETTLKNHKDETADKFDAPLTIARRYEDVHGRTVAVELRWLDVGTRRPQEERFAWADVRDPARLRQHVGVLPLVGSQAIAGVHYLWDLFNLNLGAMPVTLAVDQLGWVEDGSGRYSTCETGDVVHHGRLVGAGHAGQLARAVCAGRAGSLEDWKTVIWRLEDHPLVQVAIAHALSAVVRRRLGLPGSVLDLNGPSTTGKTSALQIAASAVGDPGRPGAPNPDLIGNWNTTRLAAIERLEACNGFPLFMDERSTATDPNLPGDIAYDVHNRRGRGQSSPDRDRSTATFTAALLSTGEGPITDRRGGAHARHLSQRAPLIRDEDVDVGKLMRDVVDALAEHHGHALGEFARMFAEWLGRVDGGVDAVRARVDDWAGRLERYATTDLGKRRAQAAAVTAYTHELAHEFELLPDPPPGPKGANPQPGYTELVVGTDERDDPALDALELLVGASRTHRDRGGHVREDAPGGLAIERSWAENLMRREHEVQLREHLPTWRERGWLAVGSRKGHAKEVRITDGLEGNAASKKVLCFVITPEGLRAAVGEEV